MRDMEHAFLLKKGVDMNTTANGMLFPSPWQAKEAARYVESKADDLGCCVIETSVSDDGNIEAVMLDSARVCDVIVTAFGLAKCGTSATDAVEIAKTSDGVAITGEHDWTAAGFKVTDKRAVVPGTTTPISQYQSTSCCFITECCVAHESDEVYSKMDENSSFFASSRSIQQDGFYYNADLGRNFYVTDLNGGDLANLQTTTRRGCAAGNHQQTASCTFCPATNLQQVTARLGDARCAECTRLDKGECYCSPMITRVGMSNRSTELAALVDTIQGALPVGHLFLRTKELSAQQSKDMCVDAHLDSGGNHLNRTIALAAHAAAVCIVNDNETTSDHSIAFTYPLGRAVSSADHAIRATYSQLVDSNLLELGANAEPFCDFIRLTCFFSLLSVAE